VKPPAGPDGGPGGAGFGRPPESRPERQPSTLRLALVGLFGLFWFAAFVALGTWQVHRRAWKLELIAAVDQRVAAPPVAAPGPAEWPRVTAERDAYRHVTAQGHYRNDAETLVQAVSDSGPGFWVMTPFVTDDGFTLLVNRGFVPPEKRSPATRRAGQIDGETRVTGLLRITEPKGGFLRRNDPGKDEWHSRDVAAIAAKRGLRDTAPYFVDADATPNAGGYPLGGLTVISFPNNHLQYALTWYALALLVLVAAFIVARHELRQRPPS
jgi:surfeit locus 1 family protein